MQRFVIVVDMQRDFVAVDGALPVSGADAIVAPMRSWLAGLQPRDVAGVLFTADTHLAAAYAGSPEAERFPLHCEKGSSGWAPVFDPRTIDPAIPDYRLEKGVFDMWDEPFLKVERGDSGETIDREEFFRALRERGVRDITVAGVAADYCVRWAVEGLVARGFQVTVPANLTRGIERQIGEVLADEWVNLAVSVR